MDFTSFKLGKADPFTIEVISIVKEIFRIVGLVGTYELLRKIKNKERCSYVDLPDTTSISSKNTRIKEFLDLKLIAHHFDRGKRKRVEWYEITEKGIKFLSILEQLDQLGDD